MKIKNTYLLILSILICLLLTFTAIGQEEKVIDPDIPESWYESPKSASDMEIDKFSQSPMLDKKTEQGELPEVEKRLPENPPVIEPYSEIGSYGGEVNIWPETLNITGYSETKFWLYFGGARITPDGKAVPSLLSGWEYSDDYKILTIHIRKGLKWSDSYPVTSEDYMYWWEHVAKNEDLNPVPPEEWNPALLNVTSQDKYTVSFHYDKPVPFRHLQLKVSMIPQNSLHPSHFMKQFHPAFEDEEKIMEMVEEVGLERWDEYYLRIQEDSPGHPNYKYNRPVLAPYLCTNRTESTALYERNPYYPFIDSEGNQLPYIDKVRANLVAEPEMAPTKAITGEATICSRLTKTSDIPMYKKNEEKEDYTTLIYRRGYGAEPQIKLNLTHPELKLRAIFQNKDFRRALSLSIDREKVNRKVYFGEAIPRQASILPTHELFKKSYGDSYAEFNINKAKQLLDKIGMVDRNGDGFREMPIGTLETMSGEKVEFEGEEFNPQLLSSSMGPLKPTRIFEILTRDWAQEIGLNIQLKQVSRELRDTRWTANEADISLFVMGSMVGDFINNSVGLRHFAPIWGDFATPWPGWVNWYSSKGERGMEPPDEIKELIKDAEIALYNLDQNKRQEAMENLFEAQADNLWTIGVVGMGPQPVIKSNNLHNVPKRGLWDGQLHYMYPCHMEQFYLEE